MPETATEPSVNVAFSGTPPGSQQGFLQGLLGRTVHVTVLDSTDLLTGILRGCDASTITVELHAGTAISTPMLIFKHAIVSIYPGR